MTLPIGTKLGPYEVLSPLGAGGMGEVYRARDSRLGRDVAIKVLPASFASDAERLRRFEQEARAASSLSDPHIVAVFDVGEAAGVHFFASELVEGTSLREMLHQGPLPIPTVLELAGQVASGLAAAHEKGIVHRDLKPENVLVSRSGTVKIADFGLAKQSAPGDTIQSQLTTSPASLTEAGVVLGTVAYMSPEQAKGSSVDYRSDQFSFGLILYEMLTGRRPLQRASVAETLSAILRDEPEPLDPGLHVPEHLKWILGRCLAKEARRRYASTRDLAMDIETSRQRGGEPAPAPGPAAASTAKGRAPSLTQLVSVGALALAAGAALALWLRGPAVREVPTLHSLTYSGHDSSPAVSPDGKTIAFGSDRDGRSRIWLKQLSTAGEAPLTEGPDGSPRFSPDGSMILFARSEGERSVLYRMAVVGGEPRRLVDDANEGDWSPDGKRLVFVRWIPNNGGTFVGLADSDGTHQKEIAQIQALPLIHPRWSPDSRTVGMVEAANGGAFRFIVLVSADNGKVEKMSPARNHGWLSSLAWNGSSDTIVYAEADSAVASVTGSSAHVVAQNLRTRKWEMLLWTPSSGQILDIVAPGRLVFDVNSVRENLREVPLSFKTGETAGRWLTRGSSSDRQPTYSPDGQWILFSSNRTGNLDLWEVSTKTGIPRRLTDDAADDWDPAFAPDGKHILWSSNRSGSFEIWMANADGSSARQVSADGQDAENPAMTPDGTWIIYGSFHQEHPGIWKVHPDGTGLTQVVKGIAPYPELSPDGRYVTCRTNDDPSHVTLRVFRLSDGATTPFHAALEIRRGFSATSVGRPRWTPDGKSVVFVGQNDQGVYGLYVQDFDPDRETDRSRKPLGGFDADLSTESFAISPDGSQIVLAGWEQLSSLMMAEHVSGVSPPTRRTQ